MVKRIQKVSLYLLLLISLVSFVGCRPFAGLIIDEKLDRGVITTSR